jgi:putative colanic acid biosynthesis UDP-glucose lipid carrier transferase
MTNNSKTNNLIKYAVIAADFMLLNALLYLSVLYYPRMADWTPTKVRLFVITINLAFLISHYFNYPIVHFRVVSVGDIVQRVTKLVGLAVLIAYLIMKGISLTQTKVGTQLMEVGTVFFFVLLISRYFERMVIKYYRMSGGNTRRVTFVGADPELVGILRKLKNDATLGYQVTGYYGDEHLEKLVDEIEELEKKNNKKTRKEPVRLKRLGSYEDLLDAIKKDEELDLGDELYMCVSRLDRDRIREVSKFCDQHVVRFFYVPVSVETIGLNLKREMVDDMEVFTTYENPLMNPVNKIIKRAFDIVVSLLILTIMLPFMPILWLIIKTQSPGPLFFKQLRTGLDGKEFYCYKFRSMHVNDDADKVQATKDDPRKYPFGNFMRKVNIDELPQFWNVLKGDMSIVGPRPHMLAHTEQCSQLIEKYMVRHFVKPGVTGWAQVTGFRGETKELWQMEGRVKRDIWYMEHWSIWLDIRIIWMTFKTIFIHDKNAY